MLSTDQAPGLPGDPGTGYPMNLEELLAANGQPTLRLTRPDGRPLFLHSSRDPGNEALRWAAAQPLSIEAFIVFGGGLGYAVDALSARLPGGVPLLVLEPLVQLAERARFLPDTASSRDRAVTVVTGSSWESVRRWVNGVGLSWNHVALACTPGYAHAFPAEFGRLDTLWRALHQSPDAPSRVPGLFAHEPGTSVVVCTFNRPAQASALVRTLGQQRGVTGPIEILLVNDNGDPGVFDAVAAHRPGDGVPVRCFDTRYPGYGLALARNVGFRFARYDTVVCLDDDLEVGESLVSAYQHAGRGLRLGRIDCRVTEAGGTRVVADPRGRVMQGASRPLEDPVARRGFLYGGNFAIDTELALAVGGFDEAFLDEGEEDMDFGARVIASIRGATVVPEALALHDGPTLSIAHDLGLPAPPQRPGRADERLRQPGRGAIVNGGLAYWMDDRWSRCLVTGKADG